MVIFHVVELSISVHQGEVITWDTLLIKWTFSCRQLEHSISLSSLLKYIFVSSLPPIGIIFEKNIAFFITVVLARRAVVEARGCHVQGHSSYQELKTMESVNEEFDV